MRKVVKGHLECWEYQPCVNQVTQQSTSFSSLNSAVAFLELKGDCCQDMESEGHKWYKLRLATWLEVNLVSFGEEGSSDYEVPLSAPETSLCFDHSRVEKGQRTGCRTNENDMLEGSMLWLKGRCAEDSKKITDLTLNYVLGNGAILTELKKIRVGEGRIRTCVFLCRSSSICLTPRIWHFYEFSTFYVWSWLLPTNTSNFKINLNLLSNIICFTFFVNYEKTF